MEELFLKIVNVSFVSCYVILFVIISRLFLKKSPKIFSYLLWLVVLFRLIYPFSFESTFSLIKNISLEPVPQNIGYSQNSQVNTGITIVDNVINNSLPKRVEITSVNPLQIIFFILALVWILGVIILISYSIFTIIKGYVKLFGC